MHFIAIARPRVVWWSSAPTPYFVDRFNAVMDRGNVDFEAWFARRNETNRSWEIDERTWRFPHRYIPARTWMGRSEHLPVAELADVKPDLFVQEYDRFYLGAAFVAAKATAGRTAFRTLPNFDAWSDRTWWRELGKHVLFRAADGAKVPGDDGQELAVRYGMPRERVSVVTQAIDVTHFRRARAMEPARREEERRRLGLEGCVFIYVGRIWRGKGLDYLVEAYREVKSRQADVSLLLVGDGVDESHYRTVLEGVENVAFAGFVQASELPDWFALADAMVFPTLGDPNGLVIEEAIASGLPVISSDAAGDVRQRVPEDRVGFVVPARDSAALAERMLQLAADSSLRQRLASATASASDRVTLEAYARDFDHFVRHVIALPPRRTFAAKATSVAGTAMVRLAKGGAVPRISPERLPVTAQ